MTNQRGRLEAAWGNQYHVHDSSSFTLAPICTYTIFFPMKKHLRKKVYIYTFIFLNVFRRKTFKKNRRENLKWASVYLHIHILPLPQYTNSIQIRASTVGNQRVTPQYTITHLNANLYSSCLIGHNSRL